MQKEDYSILESNFDGTISYVKIKTKLGHFEGYAYLHPIDDDYASSFLGCEIAEYRAIIDYLKKKRYITNIQIQTLENFKENKKVMDKIKSIEGNKRLIDLQIRTLKVIIKEKEKEHHNFIEKNLKK